MNNSRPTSHPYRDHFETPVIQPSFIERNRNHILGGTLGLALLAGITISRETIRTAINDWHNTHLNESLLEENKALIGKLEKPQTQPQPSNECSNKIKLEDENRTLKEKLEKAQAQLQTFNGSLDRNDGETDLDYFIRLENKVSELRLTNKEPGETTRIIQEQRACVTQGMLSWLMDQHWDKTGIHYQLETCGGPGVATPTCLVTTIEGGSLFRAKEDDRRPFFSSIVLCEQKAIHDLGILKRSANDSGKEK